MEEVSGMQGNKNFGGGLKFESNRINQSCLNRDCRYSN